jgi:hypothetical protein
VSADRLEEAKAAQERVLALQSAGVDSHSPEARAAVNRLMAQLRKLTSEERAAFDAWRSDCGRQEHGEHGERHTEDHGEKPSIR